MTNDFEQPPLGNVPTLIAARQATLGLRDEDIAQALGFTNPKIVAMLKAGTIKLPVNKVAAAAKVLQVDQYHLLRTLLVETAPQLWESIEEITAPVGALAAGEVNLLRHLRALAGARETRPVVFDGKAVIALVSVD